MAELHQIISRWTTINGGGKVAVMYFLAAIPIEDQREALGAFWEDVCPNLDNSTSVVVDTDGVTIDDATGGLVDSWADPTPYTFSGGGTGEPVDDAAQILVRWKTATIVGGRFLQGRTFIPGSNVANLSNGNLIGSTQTALQTAVNTFIASAAGLAVWHRPKEAAPGSSDAVSTGSVWNEFAVLRRRRY